MTSNLQYSCATIMSMLPENFIQFECWEPLKIIRLLKNFIKNFIKMLTFSKLQNFTRNTYNFQIFSIVCDRTHVWDATHTFKIFLGSKPTLLGFFKLCLSNLKKSHFFEKRHIRITWNSPPTCTIRISCIFCKNIAGVSSLTP